MKMQKTLLGVVLPSFALSSVALGAEIRVGSWERAAVNADGTNLHQSETIAVASEGTLDKVGTGTYTLPVNRVTQSNPFEVGVRSGTAVLDFADGTQEIATPSVAGDALMWLDAAVNTVGSDGTAAAWNDCRETVATAPFAHYGAVSGNAAANPQIVERNGRKMMYFRGAKSGSWMQFEAPDRPGAYTQFDAVKHIFLVVDFDTCYTYVLGGKYLHDFSIGGKLDSTSTDQTYWSPSGATSEAIYLARTYVNGERIDGTVTKVGTGLRILEIECPDRSPRFFSFFNANNEARFKGGDYIGEALFFDRALTSAERLDINAYLSRKWFGKAEPKSVKMLVAKDAQGAASVPSGTTENLSVAGEGTFVKTGAGTMTLAAKSAHAYKGGVSVVEGTLATDNPSVPYAFTSGRNVDVAMNGYNGLTITATAGTAGVAEKTGTGEVRVNSLPDDVTKLVVSAGTVTLTGMSPAEMEILSGTDIEATIPNPSFEDFTSEGKDASSLSTGVAKYNWIFEGPGNCWYARPDLLATGTSWMKEKQPYAPYLAPDGKSVLLLDAGACIRTTVSVPQTGAYELTFKTTTRDGEATGWRVFEGTPFEIQLIREDVTNTVAHFCAFRNNGFRLNRFLIPHVEAGEYVFRISNLQAGVSPAYGCTNFDDFHMKLASRTTEATVKVPNGDFETTDFTYANYTTFSSEPSPAGWTLTQGGLGGSEGGMPDVGAICYGLARHYNAASARYGNVVLFFCSNGGRAESAPFQVAPGTYRLRFRAGRWGTGSDWKWHNSGQTATPVVSSSVTVGGRKTEMTAITVDNNVFKTFTSDETFDVASAEDGVVVSLSQTVANAGLQIDEIELVPMTSGAELVTNGGFETADGWVFDTTQGTNHNAMRYKYAAGSQWYGTAQYEGEYYLMLTGLGIATQDVYFPEGGAYRLSFHVCARADNVQYRNNPLKLWWSKTDGSDVHEIAVTRPIAATAFGGYSYLFKIPQEGTYRIGLSGTVDQDKTDRIDGVSIRRAVESDVPDISSETSLDVTIGAKLNLDFAGTLPLKEVRLGGRRKSGTISAARFPDYVTGPGEVYVKPLGLSVFIR